MQRETGAAATVHKDWTTAASVPRAALPALPQQNEDVYLRSTMTSQRLNSARTLDVNRELAYKLCVKESMHEFVTQNGIRKDTFGLL